jgi:hypothetical protein
MATKGDFARILVNGWELTADAMNVDYNHKYTPNAVMAQNVGVNQFAPGVFSPSLNLNGYRKTGQGVVTAHNLLASSKGAVGSAGDTAYIASALLGHNASPIAGDAAIMMYSTLMEYDDKPAPGDVLKFQGKFQPRGLRAPIGNVMVDSSGVAGTITGAAFDRGAAVGSGTTLGGVAVLQVYTPSGTAATGTVTVSTNAADGDTLTINTGSSVVYRFKNTPIAVNDIKIGASAAATASNLFQAMIGAQVNKGTSYFTGTASLANVNVSLPSSANVITLTAINPGTAANSYTLAKTGTNLAVSGATMAGGVNGDTYSITVGSCATSGGAYTTHITFTANGTTRTAERIEIPIGTTILRFIKAVATSGGSTNALGFNVCFGAYWQQ